MEFTITKEQIERLIKMAEHGSINVIKADLKNWFPKAFEAELKVGRWYKDTTKGYEKIMGFVESIDEVYSNEFQGYGFSLSGNWAVSKKGYNFGSYNWREATEKEIEKALIAEAKKRFGDDWKNAKVKECLFHGNNPYKNTGLKIVVIDLDCNEIWNRNAQIFNNGVWAEPLIEEKTTISKEKALKIIAKKLKISPENIEIK